MTSGSPMTSPPVFGMAGLSAGPAFALSLWKRWRRGFDDVGRGRFGGSRRVFTRGGELRLQASHGSLQLLQLRSQLLASGTGNRRCFCHARVLFSAGLIAHPWA